MNIGPRVYECRKRLQGLFNENKKVKGTSKMAMNGKEIYVSREGQNQEVSFVFVEVINRGRSPRVLRVQQVICSHAVG